MHSKAGLVAVILLCLGIIGLGIICSVIVSMLWHGGATAAAPSVQYFQVGDMVQVNGWQVRVDGVRHPQGELVWQPEAGKEYLLVDMVVINGTREEVAVSGWRQVTLRGVDGYTYHPVIFGSGEGERLYGDVPAGGLLRGVVEFEVPVGMQGGLLIFDVEGTNIYFVLP